MTLKEKLSALSEKISDAAAHVLPVIIAFFAPALYVILLVFLFVIVDTYLGRKAAKHNGKELTSNRFSDVYAKAIGYGVFICAGLLVNHITGWPYCVWLAALVPLHTELTSIDENQKALGKKGIIKQLEDVYKFALNIKKKRDELR
jgi:ABC-type methionine transport system permease subunit